MSIKEFKVKILSRYCKGCGLCVDECNVEKLFIQSEPTEDGRRIVQAHDEPDCSGCLQCATICPDAAIEVYELVENNGEDPDA